MKDRFCITCFVVGMITMGLIWIICNMLPSIFKSDPETLRTERTVQGIVLWNLDLRISTLSNRLEKLEKALNQLEVKPLTEAIEYLARTNQWPYAVSQEEGVAK